MESLGALPFIGRGPELESVRAAAERAASGFGQIGIIEGEAGIGKTRLVEEVLASAGALGFEISAGSAHEVERRRPFGAFADALGITGSADDPARQRIARLLYGGGEAVGAHRTQPSGLEFQVVEAIVDLIERRCARHGVLLVLENLHWADPATLSCLHRLGRICAQLPLLVLVTARPQPRAQELESLLAAYTNRGAVRVQLGPLAADELPMLAEAVVGAPPGPNLCLQLARAGGNPLFLIELLAVLRQHGALTTAGANTAEIDAATTPAVPSLTILHRLSFLSRETLDVLAMASILGSTFSVTDLCLLSGKSAATLAAALREAITAGALAERDDRLAFRHELIRDALYDDVPLPLRQAMHRSFAQSLASAGQSPGRVAEHLLRGAQPGDSEAVEWLRRAAEEVGTRSPAVAVDLLDHALALVDPQSSQRGPILADRAMALMLSGQGEVAEAACREVLERRDDPEREGTLRWLLLRTMLIRGRAAEALQHIDEALTMRTASEPERAHYVASASFAQLVLGQLEAALQLAEQAIELAEPTGDALAVSETLHAKAQVRSVQGRLVESAELAGRAVRALESDDAPRGPQTATVTAGLMLIAIDQVDEGREMLLRGGRLNESLGAQSGQALHHVMLADGLFLVGEWEDAATEIEASAVLTGDGGPAWPVLSLGVLALMAVHRDELDAAQAHLAAAQAALSAGAGPVRFHRMVMAGALLAEASGRNDEALAALGAGWDRLAAAGIGGAFPEIGPELVRRLVTAGQRDKARDVATAVQACANHNAGVANVAGAALLCRGLAENDPDMLAAAVVAYRAGAQPLNRALACEDAAAACARGARRSEARALLTEARELYEGLGAQRCVRRSAAALRALGVRPGTRTPRVRARTGWEALTATERKVVALVAQRLSNPEIAERMYLSRRTIETHVSHALAKFGVSSRLELAAEVIRLGHGPGAGQELSEDRQQL